MKSCLRTQWVLMDLLKTTGVMPGDLGDFLRTSGYETWAGFELVFWFFRGSGLSTLQLGIFLGRVPQKRIRSCLPTQGRVSLKNQVLPKHCFFRALFWFFRGSGRVDPAKPGSFSQFGVFFGRVPLKNKVLPPDTVGFDGSSRDNWCYAWGSWGFPGDVWIWGLDWVRAGVLIL